MADSANALSDLQGQLQPSEMPDLAGQVPGGAMGLVGGGDSPFLTSTPGPTPSMFPQQAPTPPMDRKEGIRNLLGTFLYSLGQGLQASANARPGWGGVAGLGASLAAPQELRMHQQSVDRQMALAQSEIAHRQALEAAQRAKDVTANKAIDTRATTAQQRILGPGIPSKAWGIKDEETGQITPATFRGGKYYDADNQEVEKEALVPLPKQATPTNGPPQLYDVTLNDASGKPQEPVPGKWVNGQLVRMNGEPFPPDQIFKTQKIGTTKTTGTPTGSLDWSKVPVEVRAALGPPPDLDPKTPEGRIAAADYGQKVIKLREQIASVPGENRMRILANTRVIPMFDGNGNPVVMRTLDAPGSGLSPISGFGAMEKTAAITGSFGELEQSIGEVKHGTPDGPKGLDAIPNDTRPGFSTAAMVSDSSLARAIGSFTGSEDQIALAQAVRRLREGVLTARRAMGMGPLGSDAQVRVMLAQLPDTSSLASLTAGELKKQVEGFERIKNKWQQYYEAKLPTLNRTGGVNPKPGQAVTQFSPSTNQYRYSTDGGKTWKPGRPPQ